MRILLIGAGEDEKLRAALRRGQVSFDGQAAGETLYLPENVYDVLVFFSAKPDAELFSTISQLRGENIDTPVLVLAEHATARSRIRLLDAGADNVLPYPCISSEILAHIHALARRVPQMQREVITAGDLTLDRSSCVLRSRTGETRVSRKELQLVELFLRHPGQILPRETLHQKVWGLTGRPPTTMSRSISRSCGASCARSARRPSSGRRAALGIIYSLLEKMHKTAS